MPPGAAVHVCLNRYDMHFTSLEMQKQHPRWSQPYIGHIREISNVVVPVVYCIAPFVLAAYSRAKPCCSGLRACLCCPAWQLVVVVAVYQLPNKDSIIIILLLIPFKRTSEFTELTRSREVLLFEFNFFSLTLTVAIFSGTGTVLHISIAKVLNKTQKIKTFVTNECIFE